MPTNFKTHFVWSVRQVLQILLALLLSQFIQQALNDLEPLMTGMRLLYLGIMTIITALLIIMLYDEQDTTQQTTPSLSLHNRIQD